MADHKVSTGARLVLDAESESCKLNDFQRRTETTVKGPGGKRSNGKKHTKLEIGKRLSQLNRKGFELVNEDYNSLDIIVEQASSLFLHLLTLYEHKNN